LRMSGVARRGRAEAATPDPITLVNYTRARAAQCQCLVAVEAEPLRDDGGSQRQHRSAVHHDGGGHAPVSSLAPHVGKGAGALRGSLRARWTNPP